MKLPAAAREILRRRLREHPDVLSVVPKKSAIATLSKKELLAAADALGISAEDAVNEGARAPGMEAVLEPEALDLMRHCERHPAFSGVLEFEIGTSLLGVEAKRRARADYTYTPDWEYFDAVLGRPIVGWGMSSIGMEIEHIPSEGKYNDVTGSRGERRLVKAVPRWVKLDPGEGLFTQKMWDAIETLIDERSKAEDAERRLAVQSAASQSVS